MRNTDLNWPKIVHWNSVNKSEFKKKGQRLSVLVCSKLTFKSFEIYTKTILANSVELLHDVNLMGLAFLHRVKALRIPSNGYTIISIATLSKHNVIESVDIMLHWKKLRVQDANLFFQSQNNLLYSKFYCFIRELTI